MPSFSYPYVRPFLEVLNLWMMRSVEGEMFTHGSKESSVVVVCKVISTVDLGRKAIPCLETIQSRLNCMFDLAMWLSL